MGAWCARDPVEKSLEIGVNKLEGTIVERTSKPSQRRQMNPFFRLTLGR